MPHLTRRRLLAGAAAALGVTAAGAAAGASVMDSGAPAARTGMTTPGTAAVVGARARRPNLVLILADDLGHGELGAYGQRLLRTPHLDRLAAEGVRFDAAYAPAPVCAPSRCSLLTGRHVGHAAIRTNPMGQAGRNSFDEDDVTFATLLKDAGYRTSLIGKWGFGPDRPGQPSHPLAQGFDEFYGYISHGAAHDYHPETLWDGDRLATLPGNTAQGRETYAPELFRRRALDFLSRGARGGDPFLLVLAPNLPHSPSRYTTPAEQADYAELPWPASAKGHAVQVAHFDALVGSVVDRLRAEGLAQDTLVLVTGDNGAHEEGGTDPRRYDATGGLRGTKRTLYEGGVRVPLIAWAPGRLAPGTVSDRPTPLYDVLPTFADLAGARIPEGTDGLSLAPLLRGGTPADHRYLYWYRNDPYTTPIASAAERGRGDRVCEAIRQGDWKLLRWAPARDRGAPDDRWEYELYDLRTDPREQRDVAAEHPALVAQLTARLHQAWNPPLPLSV